MNFGTVVFLDEQDLSEIHEGALAEHGGTEGLLNRDALLSALGRPQHAFGDQIGYPTIATMAAALLESLVMCHGFVDANKRTAFAATVSFLEMNHRPLRPSDHWEDLVMRVVAHTITFDDLVLALAAGMEGGDEPVVLDDP